MPLTEPPLLELFLSVDSAVGAFFAPAVIIYEKTSPPDETFPKDSA
ncbi:hypothetical protein [Nesterenkonia ebinurensis]|nr:hypothetical protein [Nesterenkonia ebinurensis]